MPQTNSHRKKLPPSLCTLHHHLCDYWLDYLLLHWMKLKNLICLSPSSVLKTHLTYMCFQSECYYYLSNNCIFKYLQWSWIHSTNMCFLHQLWKRTGLGHRTWLIFIHLIILHVLKISAVCHWIELKNLRWLSMSVLIIHQTTTIYAEAYNLRAVIQLKYKLLMFTFTWNLKNWHVCPQILYMMHLVWTARLGNLRSIL